MKVLLTIPFLKAHGGVAGYYRSILPYLETREDLSISRFEMGVADSKNVVIHPLLDQLRFIRKLNSDKFDVVHINPSLQLKSFIRDGLFIYWAKRKKIPVIVFFHGWGTAFYKKISGFLKFFFDHTYGVADCFIVLASEFKSELKNKGIQQPIYLMTTAVDESLINGFSIYLKINRFKKMEPAKILFLSRIEREKGIFETIEACSLLINKGYDIRLSIAGDGSAKPGVENYISDKGLEERICSLGYVTGNQKRKAFEEHHVYCFPTYHGEGMPASVLEALSFGMPVVTRPVGGLKDFFIDGKMGYMSKTTKPHEIASCIETLISDTIHIRHISKYNYEYAKKHFLASQVAGKLADLYKEIKVVNP